MKVFAERCLAAGCIASAQAHEGNARVVRNADRKVDQVQPSRTELSARASRHIGPLAADFPQVSALLQFASQMPN